MVLLEFGLVFMCQNRLEEFFLSMADVISDQQLDLNRSLHANNTVFGSRPDAGGLTARLHKAIMKMHESGICSSVVDYGTGKGSLVSRLCEQLPNSISVQGYDPAVKKYKNKPSNPVAFHLYGY